MRISALRSVGISNINYTPLTLLRRIARQNYFVLCEGLRSRAEHATVAPWHDAIQGTTIAAIAVALPNNFVECRKVRVAMCRWRLTVVL